MEPEHGPLEDYCMFLYNSVVFRFHVGLFQGVIMLNYCL